MSAREALKQALIEAESELREVTVDLALYKRYNATVLEGLKDLQQQQQDAYNLVKELEGRGF